MRRRAVLIGAGAVGVVAAAVVWLATGGGSAPPPDGLRYARLDLAGHTYPYAVYLPPQRRAGGRMPLVVVLHGCNMTPAQQAAASEYDTLAKRQGFAVLYPDVDAIDVFQGRCWKAIWDPGAEGRGRGDAAAIATMTRTVTARWRLDPARVYAIGISAGAFETSILGAVYPDVYAAIGIHSGADYLGGVAGCLNGTQSPAQVAALSRAALAAMGARARVMPVIVFHGGADHTVPYHCGRQALAQWLGTDNLILQHDRQPPVRSAPRVLRATAPGGGHAYTVTSYRDRRGCPVAELWTIDGMGHFWSGGSPSSASARFSDPRGPSATVGSWEFFSRWRLSASGGGCVRPAG